MTNIEAMENTAYTLDYEGYASGNFTSGSYSYVQPHAPRTIVQYPVNGNPDNPDNPLVKKQLLEYDANGNMLAVKQEISDPSDPLGNTKLTLRKNIWDEENRLRAVDLNPEAPDNQPEVAAYTYDAAGERIVKYLPGRLDAYYSAKAAGSADRMEAIIYPSPLLTVKTKPLPEGIHPELLDRTSITTYTKHYYIGTERISSALGTMKNLGVLCEWNFPGETQLVLEVDGKVQQAQDVLANDYTTFEKIATLPAPFLYEGQYLPYCRGKNHDPENYHPYWYHPDHLGSSNYITNLAGEINQHMEYLPFGETLVEEHLNSYNSPYKFSALELDAETGNYYASKRYYNPKWSLWLSPDVLATEFPSWSPYSYSFQNPLKYTDVTGMAPETANKPLDDYKIDKQGNITLIQETDDNFDRILKTNGKGEVKYNRKGEAKVAVDKISKGILKDGLNLKENDGSFDVNGEGQPTLEEFNKFISEFSDYVDKEIAGVRLGRDKNSNNVDRVKTYRYENSTKTRSETPMGWFSKFGDYLKGHFHTHPYGDHTPSKSHDIPLRKRHPNLPFFIIAGGNEKNF